MANYLQVSEVQAMIALFRRGAPKRWIARALGVDPKTVRRYRKLWEAGALATSGADGPDKGMGGEKGPEVPTGSRSRAAAYHDLIVERLGQGQHARSIHYDLHYGLGIAITYDSIKRYARKLGATNPALITRLEYPPGDAAQLDFGAGAPTKTAAGRWRRPKLFIITLCASRKAYREAIWDEKLPTLLGCLERAFAHFGGVPATLIPDNPKTMVLEALWQDPVLNRRFADFCGHYGTDPLPCHPRSPAEKGIVENGVNYAQKLLAGRRFESLAAQNAFLREWDERVADKRIHGTTKQQVAAAFAAEQPFLKPLPETPYEYPEYGERVVHMDGYVEVKGAYYPVPEIYLGQRVEVRFNDRMVRVHDRQNGAPIVVHPRVEPGTRARRNFATSREIVSTRQGFENRARRRAEAIGRDVGEFADVVIARRGTLGYRFLQSLPALARTYGAGIVAAAAREAVATGVASYKPFKSLCVRHAAQLVLELDYTQNHDVIRPLAEYQSLIP